MSQDEQYPVGEDIPVAEDNTADPQALAAQGPATDQPLVDPATVEGEPGIEANAEVEEPTTTPDETVVENQEGVVEDQEPAEEVGGEA